MTIHSFRHAARAGAALVAMLAVAAVDGAAQSSGSGDTPRAISMTGEAEIRVVPDEVVYNFGIETSNKDIDQARRENDTRVKELLELTRRLKIAQEHVQTDYMSIEPDYVETEARYGEPRGRNLVGYVTRRNVMVTLKDLSNVEGLVTEALRLGVNSVDQGEFRTSELRKHRDQARLNAVRAAREKASALAGELGAKLGRPLSITEEGIYDYPWSSPYGRRSRAMLQNSMMEVPMAAPSSGTLAPGQIMVVARVNVIFELE